MSLIEEMIFLVQWYNSTIIFKDTHTEKEFNEETGAFKVRHKDHKRHENDEQRYFPERLTGDDLEDEFFELAYKRGHGVVYRAEAENTTDLDMILDEVKMDLVSVTKNSTTFRNQLQRKNEQLKKYNALYDESNNSVCMYFHDSSYYTFDKVKEGLNKLKEFEPDVIIKNVYVLLNDGSDILKLSFE